jgi:hypothetical protein
LYSAFYHEDGVHGKDTLRGLRVLGPTFGNPSGTPIAARGYVAVLEAMRRVGVTRLIALGMVSIKDEVNNKRSVVYAARVAAVALGARSAYKDIVDVGRVIRVCKDVCLAIIRVTVLKDDENRVVRVGYIGDVGAGVALLASAHMLSRRGFAAFVVQGLEKGEWTKKMPRYFCLGCIVR